jgi:hypothetical protein
VWRTWKVVTQRGQGAGLTTLPGLGAGLTAVKTALRLTVVVYRHFHARQEAPD